MTVTPKAFRWLLVANLALMIAASSVDAVFPRLVPEALWDAHARSVDAEIGSYQMLHWVVFGVVSVLLIGLGAAGYVGLFLLKRWGRRAALLSTFLALPLYVPLGPVTQSGWSALLEETSMLLWGAVLAIAYFGPLNARFEGLPANGRRRTLGGPRKPRGYDG